MSSLYATLLAASASRMPILHLAGGCTSRGSPTSIATAIAVCGTRRESSCALPQTRPGRLGLPLHGLGLEPRQLYKKKRKLLTSQAAPPP